MRLARYVYREEETYGFLTAEGIVNYKTVSSELRLKLPTQFEELLSDHELLDYLVNVQHKFTRLKAITLSKVKLQAPIKNPPKIICLGLNYLNHARESGIAPPSELVIFFKTNNAIANPFDTIEIPSDYTQKVDYEGEMAFIIGRKGKRIDRLTALKYVLGYMVLNDVSTRDLQFRDGQWCRGKSLDKFAPIGPWITVKDEVPDPHRLHLTTRVNGELRQDSSTANMIFKIQDIIAVLSRGMTLEPGDIIATGTPSGVGFASKLKSKLLKNGDVVEVEVEKLGVIRNKFIFT